MLLEIRELSKNFGGLSVISKLNMKIAEDEIVGLIGPNGAGKTTLFNLISGYYKPAKGKIFFLNEDISNLSPHIISKRGIGRTFQIPQPFINMTVFENVLTAVIFSKYSNDINEKTSKILEFIGLDSKKESVARDLNIGEKKLLEIARALGTNPQLLLLDEVVAGLNPTDAQKILDIIEKLRNKQHISILMIEHIMKVIMGISDRIVVLDHGEKIAEDPPSKIVNNSKVIEVYLGEE